MSALGVCHGVSDRVVERGDCFDLSEGSSAPEGVADRAGDRSFDEGGRYSVGQQHGDLCVEPVEDPGQGSAEGGVHREDKQPLRKEQEERAHGVRASGVGPSR